MSWNDYVTSKLINTVDANQHKLENVLEHGALIGCNDGVTWAASAGFAVGKNKGTVEGSGEVEIDEFANIVDAFNNNGDCKKVGGIRLSKEKFYMVNFDSDKKVMYLKKQGGGACIAKSNMAFVIGVFSTSKKMKFDGKEENQNPGMCNKVVEELQEYLSSLNY